WILAQLALLGEVMTRSFDAYELDRAVKPLGTFVDDLSTWYLRRSRERFKSDDKEDRAQAIATTREVFLEFSKLLAPVMPFIAEYIYGRMGGKKESVHLESWPKTKKADMELILDMEEVREVISAVLERRAKLGIKVRQPLGKLTVFTPRLKKKPELFYLIKEEVNVEEIETGKAPKDSAEIFKLSEEITPELMRKGQFRELLRTIQDLRKQNGLVPSNLATLEVLTDDAGRTLVGDFSAELKKSARLKEILFKQEVSGESVDVGGISFILSISVSK
ncbi:MAG: class I tRNA ligase family protein, partial [Candidatus Pacebacteria bacterium]|nr:class I tRNA ligase family protein [Candidatus Paceibacterota bacterium]